jgi:ribonuclease HI
MKKVLIYTDGACSGNPGEGGWAAVLRFGKHEKEISGYETGTTNNKMELRAAIEGLSALKEPCEVELYSDSSYLVNSFEKNWLENWKSNGWINKSKDEVKNIEMWKELDRLCNIHKVLWIKVKGHSDNEYNNRCDKLATGEIKKNREVKE